MKGPVHTHSPLPWRPSLQCPLPWHGVSGPPGHSDKAEKESPKMNICSFFHLFHILFFFFFISYSISFFHIFHLLFHILFHFFIFLFHSILHFFHSFMHTCSLLQTGFIVSHFLHLCHILLPSTFYFMFHIYFILQLFVSNLTSYVSYWLTHTYTRRSKVAGTASSGLE